MQFETLPVNGSPPDVFLIRKFDPDWGLCSGNATIFTRSDAVAKMLAALDESVSPGFILSHPGFWGAELAELDAVPIFEACCAIVRVQRGGLP